MAHVIAVSNHKGGVGKTTSVVNLGAALASSGERVLLIDLDPQANLSQSLQTESEEANIYRSLSEGSALRPIQILEGYDIIPSTLDLSGAEVELSSEAGREYILRELLEPLQKAYDYILIDCPPSLGLLTVNAFTAADGILIPLQAQYLALQGLTKLQEVVAKIQKRLNKDLLLLGVFLTQYDSRKVLHRDIAAYLGPKLEGKLLRSIIRDNVALAEAPTQGLDIFRYQPKSYGAEDYQRLGAELLEILSKQSNMSNTSNNRGTI
jgi:chromosome partitioning protein